MNDFFNISMIQDWLKLIRQWFFDNVLVLENLFQISIIIIVVAVSIIYGKKTRNYLQNRFKEPFIKQIHFVSLFNTLLWQMPIIFSIVLFRISMLLSRKLGYTDFFPSLLATLLLAWVVIKLASSVILDTFWSRIIAISAWSLAALNIMGMLDSTINFLDSFGITVGDIHLTALSIFKAVIVLIVFLRFGNWLGDYFEGKIKGIAELSPTTRVLLSKIIKISVFIVVCMVALNSVGIDLTALAVFSGAVGVGIGFGLQKVVANLISGIILLIDKSIKPGDVIQVEDVYGWISSLGGRYVSVVTRDGKEYLIPNEDLITQQVINWSFSDRKVRLKVPIGISYKSDPHKAIALILETTKDEARVLKRPEPVCLLVNFGDSSLDLELRFWIDDPQNGTTNLKSRVLLNVWNKFQEHGIEIPFPQQDIHFDADSPVNVINLSNKDAEPDQ